MPPFMLMHSKHTAQETAVSLSSAICQRSTGPGARHHLLEFDPRLYPIADGTVEIEGPLLLELEDVAKRYRHPSIIDIKVWPASCRQRRSQLCSNMIRLPR